MRGDHLDDAALRRLADLVVEELWARLHRQQLLAGEYLSPRQVVALVGISAKTLERMRGERTGPAYFKVGHAVRYRAADVRAWLESDGPVE